MGNISMDGSNFLAKKMFGELWITPSMWSNSSCWIATGLQAHQSIVLRQWMVMEAFLWTLDLGLGFGTGLGLDNKIVYMT